MRIFTPILLCGFIALTNPLTAVEAFLESGGRVIMEVESVPVAGSWTKETYAAGYTGTAFYEWKKGDPAMGTVAAGTGILSYPVIIATTGRYRLQIRSNPAANTEHNDVWVRVRGASKVEAVKGTDVRNLGENWTKSYNNAANQWTWNTNTVDHDAHAFYVEATAGSTITVELSGRSTQFKIDRIVLYTSTHTTAAATSTALVESPRGSGGGVGGGTTTPLQPAAPTKSGDGTATPTVEGTTSPGATVHIFDNGTEVGTVIAGSDGKWTYTLTGLSAGSHAITVTAQNVGGTSPPSVATNVSVAAGGSSTPPASDGGGGGSGCGLGGLSASLIMALFAFLKFAHSLRTSTRLETHSENKKRRSDNIS